MALQTAAFAKAALPSGVTVDYDSEAMGIIDAEITRDQTGVAKVDFDTDGRNIIQSVGDPLPIDKFCVALEARGYTVVCAVYFNKVIFHLDYL